MIKKIIVIKDAKAESYYDPVFIPSTAQALRSFDDIVNDPSKSSEISKHPEDFYLLEIGEFDSGTCTVTIYDVPKVLSSALDMVRR